MKPLVSIRKGKCHPRAGRMPGPGDRSRGGAGVVLAILTLSLLSVSPASSLEPPRVQWERFFGGLYLDEGKGMARAPDGGYLLCGILRSSESVVSSDAWLIKTDNGGNAIWNRIYGGPKYDSFSAVGATRDGGSILTGSTLSFTPDGSQAAWLVKTDPSGLEAWNRTFGNGAGGTSVLQTPDGGYVVAGTSSGDAYLFRTSPDGTLLWERRFGGAATDSASSVIMTPDGGFAMAGTTLSFGTGGGRERMAWLIKTDGNGNEVWNRTYGNNRINYGNAVQEIPGNGFIIAGYTDPYPSPGNRSVYLARTGPDGSLLWEKTPGDHGLDEGWTVQLTPDGGFLIGGISWTRAFLQKTDASGNLLWDGRYGAAFNSHFNSAVLAEDGGYIAIGAYEQVPNNWDFYVVKFVPEAVRPVADFSAAPGSGGAPLQVHFTDTSLNVPTVWAWDFNNDGVVDSSLENPSFTYGVAGIYSVGLSVANAAGRNSTVKSDLITVLLPLPGLTRAPTDPDGDRLYEDLDGDGNVRFSDVVLFFRNMEWIAEQEPVRCFDLNGNGRIDFNDVVKLFQEL